MKMQFCKDRKMNIYLKRGRVMEKIKMKERNKTKKTRMKGKRRKKRLSALI